MLSRALLCSLACAAALPAFADLPSAARMRHEYHLQDVQWDLSFDFADGAITGDVTNTIVPNRDDAELYFDCGKLDITAVDVDGAIARTDYNGKVLQVKSPSKIVRGKQVKVRIRYTGKPEAGIYFVPAARSFPAHTDIVYTQGEMEDTHYWLPTYDYPDDKATFEGTIHVPKGWKALSNGRLVGVKHDGATDVWDWKMDEPCSTYLISMVAGPYDEVQDGSEPVPVSYWVPEGLDDWGKQAFGGTDKIVQFYSKLTGVPFAWPKYAQSAVADFMFGGMENVSCTTQTIGALHPARVDANDDTTGLVAHELAHQWFGDLVTTRDWAHIWLNEGWASFLPNFWDRERLGVERYNLDRLGVFEGGLGASLGNPNRSEVWSGYQEPIDAFDGFAYPGGASRMFMLMHQVGEQKFWPAIKNYLTEYRYRNATTEQFFASMSKSLGMNFDVFRQQWFYTPAAPILTVFKSGTTAAIREGKTLFSLPLDVWLIDSDSKIEKRKLDLSTEPGAAIPNLNGRLVMLDPEVWLMADIHYDMGYTAADWKRMYDAAPNWAQKMRILETAYGSLTDADKLAWAQGEKAQPLLERMTGSLGDAPFLLSLIDRGDVYALPAIQRLGGLPSTPDVVAKLKDQWLKNPNDIVREAALNSLLSLTKDATLADSALRTDSYNDGYRISALRWLAGADPNKAREVALKTIGDPSMSEPFRLEAMRTLGRVKDLPGEHRAYDALVPFLSDRSNSPLRTAIHALADYGDKAAIPLIQARADHSLHFVRRDVEAALAQLGGK